MIDKTRCVCMFVCEVCYASYLRSAMILVPIFSGLAGFLSGMYSEEESHSVKTVLSDTVIPLSQLILKF